MVAACDTTYSGRDGTIEYPGSGASPSAVATYVTRQGDTVDSISALFGVPRDTIIQRNGLKEPYKLRPGTHIALPNARFVDTTTARGAPPSSAPPPSTGPAPSIGRVEARDLPPPAGTPAPPTSAAPAPPTSAVPPPAAEPTPRMTPPASALPAGAPRFDWPVRGRTLAGFGPRAGGQQNDGIDIAASAGTAVKAADGGTVVYSGELRGLGNLLLVSHTGGYITAYAHLDKMSVAKGATVKKGQTIGTVGTSGGASEPQLHFEIRHRNKPVDPVGLLPR